MLEIIKRLLIHRGGKKMRIPPKHSGKWFLTYLVSSLLVVTIMFSTTWFMNAFQEESYDLTFLAILIIPTLFINLVLTVMGFFGWLYMWSFSELGLIVSSLISVFVLIEDKAGWELFVALYLMVLIVGVSGLLGTVIQIINFIKNRKKEEASVEVLSLNGKRIIFAYGLLLLSGLLYLFWGVKS